MDIIDEAYVRLRLAVKDGSVRDIDEAVSSIISRRNPESIKYLLESLCDEAEYDEGMFSIIHAAEAFDDKTYTSEFMSALPHLIEYAPRWASITFMRLVNNPNTKRCLLQSIPDASAVIKESITWLCERIGERRAVLAEKLRPVLDLARSG